MENKKILIVGAGIAGLTLAYWLKKYGFIPTIVEKHPKLRTEGYKLDIRGKGVEVVKRMNLLDKIGKERTQILKAQYVDERGKILIETTPDLCGVRTEGDLEIVRGNLCRILFEHLEEIEIIFDDSIKMLIEEELQIQVTFDRGGVRHFDLVIGADGLHSRVRKLGFGKESDFLKELGLYISFYSIPNFLHLDRVEIEYHAPRRFSIAYCPKDGMAKAGFAFTSKRPDSDLSIQKNQQDLLEKAFSKEGWQIPKLLSYMKESSDFYFDCMAQVHMLHWIKGRLALVGDAGYAVSPVSGQGASVAIVGAYVLAGELKEASGNHNIAFQRYEEEMRDFITKNQQLADVNVGLMDAEKTSWIKSKMIDWMYVLAKLMPGSLVLFFKNRGVKKTRKAANAIFLKDYLE